MKKFLCVTQWMLEQKNCTLPQEQEGEGTENRQGFSAEGTFELDFKNMLRGVTY